MDLCKKEAKVVVGYKREVWVFMGVLSELISFILSQQQSL